MMKTSDCSRSGETVKRNEVASAMKNLEDLELPQVMQSKIGGHVRRVSDAQGEADIRLAVERAEGFVEGLEAARCLNPATIEALFIIVESASVRH
ncbi:Uncharacterised protein [Pseudomonas fluorescens]|uniref:Uncharacterized protein n=1 Tax=Pseudomonas fluorescens TaxID=294 RepID=A0A3S4PQU3_PSEFL|nr:hypothetical protein [Pseudomonas fluorescens]VEF08460.1 Uncharacterised protein [Pseudomonas fluorescens]